MANRKNNTKLVAYPGQDRAVAAKARLDAAGEDDRAYNLAAYDLATVKAISTIGVRNKFEFFKMRFEGALADENGFESLLPMLESISESLKFTMRKAA